VAPSQPCYGVGEDFGNAFDSPAARWLRTGLASTKNLVDNVLDRCGGVDDNAVLRDVFFRLMPSHDEFAFRRLSATPLVVWSLVKPPIQRGKVDFEDKDAVEQIDKFREVPCATAEEYGRFIPVGDQGFYFVYIPDVVLVSAALRRFTSFRIALVSQLAVAMNGVVAAPLQFIANGSLAGARTAFDQIIPPAHVLENTHHERQNANPRVDSSKVRA